METENTKSQFKNILEKVESFLTTEEYLKKEILKAKDAYGKKVGKLQEHSHAHQQKNRSFFYWFLFDWKIIRHSNAYHRYLHSALTHGSKDYLKRKQLVKHQHSIFKLLKVTKKYSLIRDLYSKKKYKVLDTDSMVGIEKNAFFETRLFTLGAEYCFADYFICHPLEVNPAIYKGIKLLRGKDADYKGFLLQLQNFHAMWQRSSYIDLKLIYRLDKLDLN